MGNPDTADVDVQAAALRVVQLRSVLYRLDYLRGLRSLGQVLSAREIADRFWTGTDKIQQALATAAQVQDVTPGFSGAGPLEIAQRYAAGLLGREQMIDELRRWSYTPRDTTDGYDTLVVDRPGSWAEVEDAQSQGLITMDEYGLVLELRERDRDARGDAS